jgi:hypothetical protein
MSDETKNKTHINGNVNKVTQIEKVVGNVIIHRSSPELGTLISQGLKLIKARSWEMAIEVFESAKSLGPTEPDCYYYMALALLKGRRPKVLDYSEAIAISDWLQAACALNEKKAHFFYLWALVKSDFFLSNELNAGEPTVEQLMNKATALPADKNAMGEMVAFLASIEGNPVYDAIVNYI